MENVLISIFLFELFFTIGEYKTWLQNRNWFGKIYIFITIIFTIPAAIIVYIAFFIVFLVTFIYTLGIKEEKK